MNIAELKKPDQISFSETSDYDHEWGKDSTIIDPTALILRGVKISVINVKKNSEDE